MSTRDFGQKISGEKKPEFQSVILAGYGTALQPLTNEVSTGGISSPTPKALLPIGNTPMIFHSISWLQDAGIRDILVICPASHKPLIHEAIWRSDESSPSFSHLSIALEGLDDTEAASLDTADILRKFSARFITDLIILSCDFIPPSALRLSSIINEYRIDLGRPLVNALLYERGDSLKDGPGRRIHAIDKQTKSLVYVGDTEDDEEGLQVGMNMLWRYPNSHITRRFLDAHVYIVRHVALELLAQRPSLRSFKDEFLPWFCKLSYRTSHRKKYLQSFHVPPDPQSLALQYSSIPYTRYDAKDVKSNGKLPASTSQLTGRDSTMSPVPSQSTDDGRATPHDASNNAPKEDIQEGLIDPNCLRCGVTLHRMKDGYAGRANTVGAYFELNRQALTTAAAAAAGPVATPLAPTYGTNAKVSTDSRVAASVRVGERSSIKKSAVGPHCVIGKNVKISGCVIMDHVEVKDGVKLENTILSRNTVVEERAHLRDCEIAPGVTVQKDVAGSLITSDAVHPDSVAQRRTT